MGCLKMKTFNAYNFFIEQRDIKAGNLKTNMIISKHEKITCGDFHQSVTEKYASFFRQIDDCSRMGLFQGAKHNEMAEA